MPEPLPAPRTDPKGLAYGTAAYLCWGLAPLYFKAVKAASPAEIVSHRVIWSVLLLGVLVAASGRQRELAPALRPPGRLAIYALTTSLISFNWGLFIWAVNGGHLLEASLGYFINPLVNVLLGVLFLGERLSRLQRVAVALAAVGVALLVLNAGVFPWISLGLAASFGLYGLVRKRAAVDPLLGLLIETSLLAPLALAWLFHLQLAGTSHFGSDPRLTALLVISGVITSLPLVWFTHGVRRLPLSTMGLLQYLTPTGHFLLAVWLYGEPFTAAHVATFACIWASLAVFTVDALGLGNARR